MHCSQLGQDPGGGELQLPVARRVAEDVVGEGIAVVEAAADAAARTAVGIGPREGRGTELAVGRRVDQFVEGDAVGGDDLGVSVDIKGVGKATTRR